MMTPSTKPSWLWVRDILDGTLVRADQIISAIGNDKFLVENGYAVEVELAIPDPDQTRRRVSHVVAVSRGRSAQAAAEVAEELLQRLGNLLAAGQFGVVTWHREKERFVLQEW